ncbi:site-specific integrase [Limimaricola sp. G21655-S1]|uniref:tyrosine-type recombinase/integrase n=1 Tax=Limimaricola sp. G21655-S1 TaxID=3014768 RepID=UPI0022B007B5|nr:site-specific integrase [Limimaricola sp. G21655-S1]MCZ4263039.1 site-specific integrase [Limimaricola sp. G21655-S1]
MKDLTSDLLTRDAQVPAALPCETLDDVRLWVVRQPVSTRRRDALSAFRFLSETAGLDLTGITARPRDLRELFAGLSAPKLGVSLKRLANVRSLVGRARDEAQAAARPRGPKPPIAAEWTALLETVPWCQYRWGLNRLARYCTQCGIKPEEVSIDTLSGLRARLEQESTVKKPQLILKQTIAFWNRCEREVEGWPDIRLSLPTKPETFMLPLDAFPESLGREIDLWATRMQTSDPFDPKTPVRAMRPPTVQSYILTIRKVASALVRGGHLEVDEVTGLDVLVSPGNFKNGLRRFASTVDRNRAPETVHKMAVQLRSMARNLLDLDEAHLAELDAIIGRLAPRSGRKMGARNFERLKQFDDPDLVQRLLGFPDEELGRALKARSPVRRAKGVERALAIAVALYTGLRVKNLRSLRLDTNLVRSGDRLLVRLSEDEMKTHAALEIELPSEVITLLDLFVNQHRHILPSADGPYLFPGERGGPRSYDAMRDAVSRPLLKHAGIEINPHLYRHVIAKIVAERRPELLADVSRHLGHRSFNTTYQSYLGTEGPAASRRLNRLLDETRRDPRLER